MKLPVLLIRIPSKQFKKDSRHCARIEPPLLLRQFIRTLVRLLNADHLPSHRLSTIMKADRIIVVMNGEIVEEGSHEELIHKKGKYQNLWSKQLFVKPADERGERCRSRSPQKRDANIINDLTPGRQTTELAKVLKTTPHEEPSKNEAAQDVGRKSDSSDDPCGGHKREVSEDAK